MSAPIIQGCFKRSYAITRFLGSSSSIILTIFSASPVRSSCYLQTPLCIRQYRSYSFAPRNGNSPVNITYNSTPSAQISTGRPSQSFFLVISGAMQLGVPQKTFSRQSLVAVRTENPKSISLTMRVPSSIKILSNLISLWITPRLVCK